MKEVKGATYVHHYLLHKRDPAEFLQRGLIRAPLGQLRKTFGEHLRTLLTDSSTEEWETLQEVVLIQLLEVATGLSDDQSLKEYF